MLKFYQKLIILGLSLLLARVGWMGLNGLFYQGTALALNLSEEESQMKKINKSKEDWKKELTADQFRVMFERGTEPAFSGKYNDFWKDGLYNCAACGAPLFKSEDKYDHKTGWPSFKESFSEANLVYRDDLSFGVHRIEVRCISCGAHLGHLFYDGPESSGKHFCINSLALEFQPAEQARSKTLEVATLAAGCFWGVEHKLSQLKGVVETAVGYSGGKTKNPTYKQVLTGKTGHAESVQVVFDPAVISYEQLINEFFKLHDPTQLNRQGPDRGSNYRSAIFYHNEEQKRIAEQIKAELQKSPKYQGRIVTEIIPAGSFYRAEEDHQKYYQKRLGPVCPTG